MKLKGRGQTRLWSIIEAAANVFLGAVIAFSFTQFIAVPLLGIEMTPGQNMVLTTFLTIVSVLRGYIVRRIFNKLHFYEYKKQREK